MALQGPLRYEAVTIAASSTALTSPTSAGGALIQVEDAPIRWTADGATTPTSTVGMLAYPGDLIELCDYTQVLQFRAIRTGSVSATLRVCYGTQYTPGSAQTTRGFQAGDPTNGAAITEAASVLAVAPQLTFSNGYWSLSSAGQQLDGTGAVVAATGMFAMNGGGSGASAWDRYRNNLAGAALTSLGAINAGATADTATQTNYNHAGVAVCANVTAVSGSPTALTCVLLAVDGQDTSGSVVTATATVTISVSSGTKAWFFFYPGATAADFGTNGAARSCVVPRSFKARIGVTGGTSATITPSISYIL